MFHALRSDGCATLRLTLRIRSSLRILSSRSGCELVIMPRLERRIIGLGHVGLIEVLGRINRPGILLHQAGIDLGTPVPLSLFGCGPGAIVRFLAMVVTCELPVLLTAVCVPNEIVRFPRGQRS